MTQERTLSQDEINTLRQLRSDGFAVVLFNAQELSGADAGHVEDRLIELGWDVIDTLKD